MSASLAMNGTMERNTIIGGAAFAAVLLGGLGWWANRDSQEVAEPAPAEAAGVLTPEQIRRMGVTTAVATEASSAEL
ncbi:MAG: hypothetical protein NTX28_08605, partial [Novosphingobium sp.]|nr:hypothetical protein [Novosphingobium sp.]